MIRGKTRLRLIVVKVMMKVARRLSPAETLVQIVVLMMIQRQKLARTS